jgi:hypothetical protein
MKKIHIIIAMDREGVGLSYCRRRVVHEDHQKAGDRRPVGLLKFESLREISRGSTGSLCASCLREAIQEEE